MRKEGAGGAQGVRRAFTPRVLNHITMLRKSNSLKVNLSSILDLMESKVPTFFN